MAPDSFQQLAKHYENHAAVAEESGRRLLERLDGLRFDPKTIIEIGCATGRQLVALHQRFPGADLIGIDRSFRMLKQAKRKKRWWRPRFRLLQAEAAAVPFAEASADLVYVNLTISWLKDPAHILAGIRRALRPGGLVLISAFGPDTLRESLDRQSLLVQWMTDVQGLGSALVRAGFSEPVLDTDWLTTTHSSRETLASELRGAGLLPAAQWSNTASEGPAGAIDVQWEIVSASAWAPGEGQPIRGVQGEEVSIPVSQIKRRRRD